MAGVTLEHVWKRFGDTTIVKDLNLEIRDGEFLVLVGPSGCGKSTTLRMLAGLEQPTDGVIRIGDRDVTRLSPRERDTAMVFQSYALYPHMTVFENMAFGLRLRRVDDAEIHRRVEEAARMLELGPLLQRKPKEMSGGQRQRVAMGRAIVRQPAVFLFDEPLSNLDAKLRVQMRAEIARLHQRLGITMVYVTHDQTEAMTLATRIAVMKDGLLQQLGAPLDVYRNPANTFVGAFVGSPSMNFLTGEVTAESGEPRVRGDGFDVPIPPPMRVALGPAGTKVTLGIRPEHVRGNTSNAGNLQQIVEVIEPLGSVMHVVGKVGAAAFTSAVDPERIVKPGELLSLSIDPSRVHLFDATTGRALGQA